MSDSELHPLRQQRHNSLLGCSPPPPPASSSGPPLLSACLLFMNLNPRESSPKRLRLIYKASGRVAFLKASGTALAEGFCAGDEPSGGRASFPHRERPLRSRFGPLLSGPAAAGEARGSLSVQPLPFVPSSSRHTPSQLLRGPHTALPSLRASAPPAIRLSEGGEAAAGVSFDAHQGLSEPPSVRKLGAPNKSWAGSSYRASMEPPQAGRLAGAPRSGSACYCAKWRLASCARGELWKKPFLSCILTSAILVPVPVQQFLEVDYLLVLFGRTGKS
ncbi:uncharacterized protein O3Q21_013316 [Podargus strigoides]